MARRFRLETDVQTRLTKLTEVSYTQHEELLQANYKTAGATRWESNSPQLSHPSLTTLFIELQALARRRRGMETVQGLAE